ncbi:MAG: carbohydrate ABC transporter permease [Spirochaetaceae bacterium]|nr:MAG: carbohydrate ABC transporter permease [Spirochaetaceae bacterium]
MLFLKTDENGNPAGTTTEDSNITFWRAKRRWARVGIVYLVMLVFAVLFVGPLLFAAFSSLKINPLEYPPSLRIAELNPVNWVTAARLGNSGSGNYWSGGFAPGGDIPFDIQYFIPDGVEQQTPEIQVPRRRPGAGLGAVRAIEFAADHAEIHDLRVSDTEIGRHEVEDVERAGRFVTWSFRITYAGDGPKIDRVPVDILAAPQHYYISSTLPASRLERRGRVVSFVDIAPGIGRYVFRNYARLFDEARSVTTGQPLFFAWTRNSFFVSVVRVFTNLLFASMAGYALARYHFRGKFLVFLVLLFSQMVPAQVTFISNYLLLRDGLFGLSNLFGRTSLLNSLWGVIIAGAGSGAAMIEAGKVFIMKQFFETISRDVEEAALIDGANQWQRYSRVVLPIARPALGAVAILTFQGAWNEFFWPFIVLTSPEEVKTLPIGLMSFRQTYGAAGDWGLILSGAILSAIPVIILFVVFQKYFIHGVSFGGSKG